MKKIFRLSVRAGLQGIKGMFCSKFALMKSFVDPKKPIDGENYGSVIANGQVIRTLFYVGSEGNGTPAQS